MLFRKTGKQTLIRLLLVFGMLAIALSIGVSANGAFAGVPAASLSSSNAASTSGVSVPSAPFDCSQISRMGIDKQMNMHAAEILAACGRQPKLGGAPAPDNSGNLLTGVGKVFNPLYGGTDADVVTPDGTYPGTVQSETFVWAHGSTIVANYNDSRTAASCYGGISYSTDSGASWHPSQQLCTGHGTNYGDPIVVWDNFHNHWVAGDLASGCGGQGIGVWTSPDGITWTAGACAVNAPSGDGDRESMYVDNNLASPNYGTMFISYANYANTGPPISVVRSTDGGATWSAPINLALPGGASFVRNVQDTGGTTGTFYIAAMNENGGALNARTNYIYRSTDGGLTWSAPVATGPSFAAPGVATSGYFALFFPTIWRYEGWGQPGAGPSGVVHYAYTQHGAGADPGDIYYVRSTDSGVTWSAPLKLNQDATTNGNWQPSVAVTAQGAVLVSWYDGRNGTSASCGSPGSATPCYQRWGRVSLDNGATWQADAAIGDVVSGLPAQPDANIQPVYEGDYDYSSADGTNGYTCWNDGRVVISGNSQQDVFCDRIPLIVGTPTPTITPTATATAPPCGPNSNYVVASSAGASIVAGTTDTGNHGDDVATAITLPFAFTFYGSPFTTANVISNGNLQFSSSATDFTNACLPYSTFNNAIMPHWDDLNTTNNVACPGGVCGVFTSVSGSAPNRIFYIEWRAVYFAGSVYLNFEMALYENQSRIDFIYGAVPQSGTSATVGVQRATGSQTTQFECNTGGITSGLLLSFTQPPCNTSTPTSTPTRTFTPTITPTATATPAACGSSSNYVLSTTAATIVAGITDTGNHCDDCTSLVNLPFTYNLYGQPFTTANVSSNGNLQFVSNSSILSNACLPTISLNTAIMPHWDDLRTDAGTACTSYTSGCGIFTSVSGSAPNRIFNIEWRTVEFANSANLVNVEVRLYEGQNRFDLVYGTVTNAGASATVGVQRDTGSLFTQFECNTGGLTSGLMLSFTQTPCLVVGHVIWQGLPAQPNELQQMPVTMTLKSGTNEVNFARQLTDSSGFFTVPMNLSPGTYNWRTKGNTYLATGGTVVLAGVPVTQLEMGLQQTGDLNGDNLCSILDFNLIKPNIGRGGVPPINPEPLVEIRK